MMYKRIILLMLFVSIVTSAFAQLPPKTVTFKVRKAQKKEVAVAEEIVVEVSEPAFVIVEENASFNGGGINTFRFWVQKNIVFPESAAEAGISGKVIAQFAVNSRGLVVDAKVLRGVNKELDNEVVRVMLSSPRWEPGLQGGKAVKQQFVIPVVFQLQ